MMIQGGLKGVSEVSQGCPKGVLRVSQGVQRVFYVHLKCSKGSKDQSNQAMMIQGGLKAVSEVSQGCHWGPQEGHWGL